jgi:hypothetical protein
MQSRRAWWFIVLGLIGARTTLAEPVRTVDKATADRLFAEARAFAKANRLAEACERFAQSDAIERTFGTAVNLGDCAARDGHPGRAWQLYDAAAELADRDGASDLARFARDRAAALVPALCTVVVTVAEPTTPGLTIRINDRDQHPAAEIRAFVDPGDIEVVIAVRGQPPLRRTLHGVAGSVVALEVPAAAQPSGPSPTPATPPIPGFVVIDPFDARSRAGMDVAYITTADSQTVLRFGFHARYVDAASGFGGYLRVPYSYAQVADSHGAPSTVTDFGDIELGGLLVRTVSAGDVTLALHAGATLPTGETGGLEQNTGELASLIAIPEIYNAAPRGVSAMFGVSAAYRMANLFAHLDLGAAWSIYSSNYHSIRGDNTIIINGDLITSNQLDRAIHYSAGLGIELGRLAVMLESENAWIFGSHLALHAIAVSARAELDPVSLYTALVVPLGAGVSEFVELAVIAGIEFTLAR